jgi:UDP-N-acetylglucosamine acyltransferase
LTGSLIHPSAVVDPKAKLGAGVSVGPFSVVGAGVEVGAGTSIGPQVIISGPTTIGRDNRFLGASAIGGQPQDKKYAGEPTRLEIGDRNTFFEYCTVNRGTAQDLGYTRIGNDGWFMAYTHIAHDCVIADNVIMANCATLAGHVFVHDWAILGGFSKVHQFCRVGAHSFCGMNVDLTRDVPPFVMVAGTPPAPYGINSEGLRRRGFTPEQVRSVKDAYRVLYRSDKRLEEAVAELKRMQADAPELALLTEFLADTSRSIVR